MPYIEKSLRPALASGRLEPRTEGELNYVLTRVILKYLENQGRRYATMNDIIGALGACGLEFYRRVVVDYEQEKIEENGDVYPQQNGKLGASES